MIILILVDILIAIKSQKGNSLYKKCYNTCETCEIKGDIINHNCLLCNSNYSFYNNNCYKNPVKYYIDNSMNQTYYNYKNYSN